MREENNDHYDVHEIKKKLKLRKREQNQRIARVKEAHQSKRHFEGVMETRNEKDQQTTFKMLMEEVSENMVECELHMASLERTLEGLAKEKEKIETIINNAVTKWKDRDETKLKLKQLYKEL
jgi:hypothetical protein